VFEFKNKIKYFKVTIKTGTNFKSELQYFMFDFPYIISRLLLQFLNTPEDGRK
jgi:hypothetical protein